MTHTSHELPARFGPFYLFDLIGSGGMAEIFLSKTFTALGTDRLCAIKRILPQFNADASFCEMLVQEAKLCSHLSHANVVQTNDLGQIDGQYYISMEYVEGFDLNQLLSLLSRARIALPLQFALFIITQVLRGLDYAHRLTNSQGLPLGIIHRDVSPTNVLISTDGDVKLCDFGIAKAVLDGMGSRRLNDHILKGKFAYMAPEHMAGQEIDRRADLFAAGILLWELLSGKRLYKAKDEDETLRRAREAEIQPLVDRGFPEFDRLEAVVSKALSVDPDDRFQNGIQFVDALEDYMHAAGLMVSELKFAEFLMENFGEDLLRQRRERERHLSASIDMLTVPPPVEPDAPAPDEVQQQREADITASLLLPEDDEETAVAESEPPPVPIAEESAPVADEPQADPWPEPISEPAPSQAVTDEDHTNSGMVAAWLILFTAIAAAACLICFYD